MPLPRPSTLCALSFLAVTPLLGACSESTKASSAVLALSAPASGHATLTGGSYFCSYPLSVVVTGGKSGDEADWVSMHLLFRDAAADSVAALDYMPSLLATNSWFAVSGVVTGHSVTSTRTIFGPAVPFTVEHTMTYRVGTGAARTSKTTYQCLP